jgi:hypothetical protein
MDGGRFLSPVRPELVEGLPFFFYSGKKEVQGFDRLSPNGVMM